MIAWWTLPLILTLAAFGVIAWAGSDSQLPYRTLMFAAMLILVMPALALLWVFSFLLSMMTP